MKKHWQKLSAKIDGLTLRERVIIFAMVAIVTVVLFNAMLLDPLFAKQKRLAQQVKADQALIEQMRNQMSQTVKSQKDPDAENRARLKELHQQLEQLHAKLVEMESGLVSPSRMPALLGDILKRDSRLSLVSLKTLPSSPLMEADTVDSVGAATAGKVALNAGSSAMRPDEQAAGANPVFRHGVEIVVQGTYQDMLHYMDALERMPWQLFWGKAKLKVEEYPRSTLTLTLYTLSLDKQWLNL